MKTLTEQAAELLIADHAFAPGMPGLVGAAVDLIRATPGGGRLRHGFLSARAPGVVSVSSPPSPGLESCLARTADDLRVARRVDDPGAAAGAGDVRETARTGDVLYVACTADELGAACDPVGAAGVGAGTVTTGIRVGLEAGLAGGGPFGLGRRWAVAHAVAPVLAAAFANSPLRDGRPSGWRSLRQARHRDLPFTPASVAAPGVAAAGVTAAGVAATGFATPGAAAVAGWTAYVMDAPTVGGPTFREWTRAGSGPRPGLADLSRHLDALRPPVAARGHLEFDVADGQPGDGWRVAVAVTSALLDDCRAADTAQCATEPLAGEARVWERAARHGLTDPALATAARECFLAAYGALARQGVAREVRDAVAAFTERYVLRGRCPADDVLDRVTALP